MDFAITNSYRLVTEDITLLYDVYMLCKNSSYYKRGGKTCYQAIAQDYMKVLSFVVNEESLDEAKLSYHVKMGNNDYVPRSNDHSLDHMYEAHEGVSKLQKTSSHPKRNSKANSAGSTTGALLSEMDNTTAKQTIFQLTWNYLRTVILQFLVEEGSQFPFWASKVSVVVNDDIFRLCNPKNLVLGFFSPTGYPGNEVSLPRLWTSALKLRWEEGLFEGVLPYVGAIFLTHADTILIWSQRFTALCVVPYIYGRPGGRLEEDENAWKISAGPSGKSCAVTSGNGNTQNILTEKSAKAISGGNDKSNTKVKTAGGALKKDYAAASADNDDYGNYDSLDENSGQPQFDALGGEDEVLVFGEVAEDLAEAEAPVSKFKHNDSIGNMVQTAGRLRRFSVDDDKESASAVAVSAATKKSAPRGDTEEDGSDFNAVPGGYIHVDSGNAIDEFGNTIRSEDSETNDFKDTTPWKRRVGMIPSANSGEFTWNPISRTYSDDGTLFVGTDEEENFEAQSTSLGSGNNSLTVGRARAASVAARADAASVYSAGWLDSWFTFPTRLSLLEMVGRIGRVVLAHPFYMVALLMVKDQTLKYISKHDAGNKGSNTDTFHDSAVIGMKDMNPINLIKSFKWGTGANWVTVFSELVAKQGFIFCLYRGMRALLVQNLIPYNLGFFGCGIMETLLFRRMLRPVADDELQDIRDLSKDVHISTHHRITSTSLTAGTRGLFIEAQSIISKHGAWGMLSYFYMTCLQIVPGFFNFLSARVLLFLALGPSQTRVRQLNRRKELLREFFIQKKRACE